MQKATATYVAPFGDNKVCEMGGVTFFDGKSVELNSYEHPHLMSKLQGNSNFDVTVGKEDDQPVTVAKKRGRPSNAQIAEAKAASEEAERVAKEAAEKAKAAKADSEAAVKAGAAKDTKTGPTPAEPKADVKAGMAQATGHDFEKDRQAEVARRDAQARGPGEDRPDNQRGQPSTQNTSGQNQANYSGQGQSGYVGGQNQQSGLTPGNPPGGQQPSQTPNNPDHTT